MMFLNDRALRVRTVVNYLYSCFINTLYATRDSISSIRCLWFFHGRQSNGVGSRFSPGDGSESVVAFAFFAALFSSAFVVVGSGFGMGDAVPEGFFVGEVVGDGVLGVNCPKAATGAIRTAARPICIRVRMGKLLGLSRFQSLEKAGAGVIGHARNESANPRAGKPALFFVTRRKRRDF